MTLENSRIRGVRGVSAGAWIGSNYSVDKGKTSFILRAKSLEVHRRSEAIGAAFCHTGLNEERWMETLWHLEK
jgi:predicted acylesterase/phospholipase RssA